MKWKKLKPKTQLILDSIDVEALEELKKAIEHAGGQSALARKIGNGVKQAHVFNWLHRDKKVPPERAVDIEIALNGFVIREKLCPRVFGRRI